MVDKVFKGPAVTPGSIMLADTDGGVGWANLVTMAAVSLYVDAARPDDTGNGLTWATAKKNLDAIWSLVPPLGRCYIYVKGTHAHGLTTSYLPYPDCKADVRVIGADDWTTVASGTNTLYQGNVGRYGSDLYTLNLGGYACADVTDRALFLEVQDSSAVWHILKVMEYIPGSGKYDVERPKALTVNAGATVRLIRPTTTITLGTNYMRTRDSGTLYLVGIKVTAGATWNPTRGIGFAACELDMSLSNAGPLFRWMVGMVLIISTVAHRNAMDPTALAGTYLAGKQNGGSYFAGNFLKLKNTAGTAVTFSFQGVLGDMYAGANCVIEGGATEALLSVSAAPGQYPLFYSMRGVNCGASVGNGAEAFFMNCRFDGTLYIGNDGAYVTGEGAVDTFGAAFGRVEIGNGILYGWGGNVEVSRAAAHDSICVWCGRLGKMKDVVFTTGYSLATPATPRPAIHIEGDCEGVQINLGNLDRGVGPMTFVKAGARAKLTKVAGNNTNAGWGLGIDDPSFVEVTAAQATAVGSGGAGTGVKVGSLAVQPWPVAGNRVNDISAVPAATDTQAQLKMV